MWEVGGSWIRVVLSVLKSLDFFVLVGVVLGLVV